MHSTYEVIRETSIDEIEMLSNTNPEARTEFISDESLSIPNNRYDKMNTSMVASNIDTLMQIIPKMETSSFGGRLATRLLQNNLHKNMLVLLCDKYNSGDSNQGIIEEISEHNRSLYGLANERDFHRLFSDVYSQIHVSELDDEQKELFLKLNELLPFVPCVAEPLYRPSEEVFSIFRDYCNAFFEPLLRHIPRKEKFSVEEVFDIANDIFCEELEGYTQKVDN